jgi:hypothetical protein
MINLKNDLSASLCHSMMYVAEESMFRFTLPFFSSATSRKQCLRRESARLGAEAAATAGLEFGIKFMPDRERKPEPRQPHIV